MFSSIVASSGTSEYFLFDAASKLLQQIVAALKNTTDLPQQITNIEKTLSAFNSVWEPMVKKGESIFSNGYVGFDLKNFLKIVPVVYDANQATGRYEYFIEGLPKLTKEFISFFEKENNFRGLSICEYFS